MHCPEDPPGNHPVGAGIAVVAVLAPDSGRGAPLRCRAAVSLVPAVRQVVVSLVPGALAAAVAGEGFRERFAPVVDQVT